MARRSDERLTTVTTVQQAKDEGSGIGTAIDAQGYMRITAKPLAGPISEIRRSAGFD